MKEEDPNFINEHAQRVIQAEKVADPFLDQGIAILLGCRMILGNQQAKDSEPSVYTAEEWKKIIFDKINQFHPYSYYLGETSGLNKTEQEKARGLDEISSEIKSIKDLDNSKNLERLLALLQESKELIYPSK